MNKTQGLRKLRSQYFEQARHLLAKNRIVHIQIPVHVTWASAIGKDVTLGAGAARLFVKHFHLKPKVYYFGIGNPTRLGIDIVWPLLVCDFRKLVAVDIEPRDKRDFASSDELYQRFVRAVTLNLSLIPEIDQEEIRFEKLGDHIFQSTFVFRGQEREVRVFYGFNASQAIPADLESGYNILFTRRTGIVFSEIEDEILAQLKDKLTNNGMVIFVELTPIDKISELKNNIGFRLGSGFVDLTFNRGPGLKSEFQENIYFFMKIA